MFYSILSLQGPTVITDTAAASCASTSGNIYLANLQPGGKGCWERLKNTLMLNKQQY